MKQQKLIADLPKGDQIVYIQTLIGGGVDGKDWTDKGGKEITASFARPGNNIYYEVRPTVVNMEDVRAEALKKLSPVDKLVLGLV